MPLASLAMQTAPLGAASAAQRGRETKKGQLLLQCRASADNRRRRNVLKLGTKKPVRREGAPSASPATLLEKRLEKSLLDTQRQESPEPTRSSQESSDVGSSRGGPLAALGGSSQKGSSDEDAVMVSSDTLGTFSMLTLSKRVTKASRASRHAARDHRDKQDVSAEDDGVALFKARGALRRLRTVLRGADFAVKLPRDARAAELTPALQILGAIRDVDVVSDILCRAWAQVAPGGPTAPNNRSSVGPPEEFNHSNLRDILTKLKELRADRMEEAAHVLRGKRLDRTLAEIAKVVEAPTFSRTGRRAAALMAPNILVQETATLFLHDGWWIRAVAPSGRLSRDRRGGTHGATFGWERALGVDGRRCERLHDLRKAIRESRYALETFQPMYAESRPYAACLEELILLQRALGSLRDIEVTLELAPEVAECPALLGVLRSDYKDHFSTFLHRRERVLRPELRSTFLEALFYPSSTPRT